MSVKATGLDLDAGTAYFARLSVVSPESPE